MKCIRTILSVFALVLACVLWTSCDELGLKLDWGQQDTPSDETGKDEDCGGSDGGNDGTDDGTDDGASMSVDMNAFNIVMKREFPGDVITNMATPTTRKQVQTLLEQPISATTLLQSYVPCKGGKAAVARIAWCSDRPSYGFMMSNRVSSSCSSRD